MRTARRTSAVVVSVLALAVAMPARADHPAVSDSLPRQLALSEPRPADGPPASHQTLQVAIAAALHPVAERMAELPNPYSCAGGPAACGRFPEGCRSFPEHAQEPPPEDPNDLMGIPLGRGAIMGLHVDLVGPSELPETYTRLTNPRRDPTDLKYLQTSLGLRIGF